MCLKTERSLNVLQTNAVDTLVNCLRAWVFTMLLSTHSDTSLPASFKVNLVIGSPVVQTMTGHSSLGMLQKYSHSGLSNKQHAMQALTDYVLGIKEKVTLAIAQ